MQTSPAPAPTALIAIGGNSLVRADEHPSVASERRHVAETCTRVAELVADGWRVVLTHGNGPQVGAALRRSELAAGEAYPLPLDVCVATTQAEIGFLLEQALDEALAARGVSRCVATVVTRVRVDPGDPAFAEPTKPIGSFYNAETADAKRRVGWTLVEEPPHGFRRAVPSPEPLEVLEESVIRALIADGTLVVALGGGGIPVVREHALWAREGGGGAKLGHERLRMRGVEAVVDKDLASALLAARLGVDVFAILTDVDGVYVDFGGAHARRLGGVTAAELKGYASEGHFPPGSMGPKVEALIRFVEAQGGEAIVTTPEQLPDALRGGAGTHVRRG